MMRIDNVIAKTQEAQMREEADAGRPLRVLSSCVLQKFGPSLKINAWFKVSLKTKNVLVIFIFVSIQKRIIGFCFSTI